MSKKENKTPNSLEEYKLYAQKREHRHNMTLAIVVTLFFGLTVGLIGGYFLSGSIINDSQSKAIKAISAVQSKN